MEPTKQNESDRGIDRWRAAAGAHGVSVFEIRGGGIFDIPPAGAKQVLAELLAERADTARLEREDEELAKGILDLTRRLTIAEQRTHWAEMKCQTAFNTAEMWRRRARAANPARERLLPLAYLPAGEEPGARWGLTELGQQAVDIGRVKGPEWTLLLSPDPREVLSIEVRRGSRQEEIYRSAGYVTAEEPD